MYFLADRQLTHRAHSHEYAEDMENSRFKYFLIPNDQLERESLSLKRKLQPIFTAHDRNQITIPQMLFLVIATVCEQRKPRQWWMKGRSPLEFLSEIPNSHFFELATALSLPAPVSNLNDFFSMYRLKNLPHAIAHVLWLWCRGDGRLQLNDKPVSPFTMLSLQAQGQRVVTCSHTDFLNGTFVDARRDGLEFLLHDLTHADLFFSETHEEQRRFFLELKGALDKLNIADFNLDLEFKTSLEYIMSDMNSNRAHLVSSLKAVVIAYERRRLQLEQRESLGAAVEWELCERWGNLWDVAELLEFEEGAGTGQVLV